MHRDETEAKTQRRNLKIKRNGLQMGTQITNIVKRPSTIYAIVERNSPCSDTCLHITEQGSHGHDVRMRVLLVGSLLFLLYLYFNLHGNMEKLWRVEKSKEGAALDGPLSDLMDDNDAEIR